jgi:murein DD-endopeptidase MepM/ murein hydrolase activator NlpD
MTIEQKILRIYNEIKESKKSVANLHEAALISPVDNTSVNSGFGPRWNSSHNGVDLKADAAQVKAPADGVVTKVAVDEYPCGGTIVIDHADGFKTGFCHMQKINVSSGQQVKQGDVIGISGGGANDPGKGRSDGRHLHFTLRKNGQLVNPMDYIGKEGIVMTGNTPTSTSTSKSSEDAYNYATSTNKNTTTSSVPKYAPVVGTITSAEGMNEEIQEILNLYDAILNEASSASSELFGGSNVKIPSDGAHAGQSGWQSSNAWDIAAPVGTPVYALADGVAQTFSDYGREVRATQGKKLYGQSFTVKSDGGLPDIYYTHLEGSPVMKGSTIKCGQFLGYIMDFPNSSYDHVHIGVSSGNIRQFLNDDGTMKCAKGQTITGGEVSNSPTSDDAASKAYDYATNKESSSTTTSIPKYAQVVGTVTSAEGLNEQKNFGKNISNRYGRVIIPKDDNPRIKSPISGVINNKKYFSGCVNQVTIENNDNGTVYLQFCGISNPKVSNGKSVGIGDVLGTTDSDVEVIMYDNRWNRINIPDRDLKIDRKEKESEKEIDGVKKSSEPEYYDPMMAAILGLPGKLFQDKFDKSGNRVEKRYGGVADKKQVDPWVLNFLEDPFKRKKVNENIEKIKKML